MDRLNVEEPGFLRSIIGSKQFTLNIFNLNMDDLEVMINEYNKKFVEITLNIFNAPKVKSPITHRKSINT